LPPPLTQLVVITGAGASYDCAGPRVSTRGGVRPPLVTQLFDTAVDERPVFAEILHEYPRAEQAAADIRPHIKSQENAIPLERFLRERLFESTDNYTRQRYLAIPLYLQHLLHRTATTDSESAPGYTPHPDNYDRLVNAALALDEAVFVTLNYDDLLDRRLFINESEPPTDLDAYVVPGRRWSLVKLHGSINWGREVEDAFVERPISPGVQETFTEAFSRVEDFEERLSPQIEFCDGRNLADYRYKPLPPGSTRGQRMWSTSPRGTLRYPALAVPLGAEDELVCPPSHLSFLRKRLQAQDGLNLLVIGYSGLDTEVLKLLRESENTIRRLLVVDPSEKHAMQAAENIGRAFGRSGFQADWPCVQTFSHFAQERGLQEFIETVA
jgi:hypothetical protein